jgi:nucleotide-binding universal stress UspA family protein
MKILLYVDDSRFWHNAAKLVSAFAKAERAHVTVVTTAWLAMHRTRALQEARKLLDLPDAQLAEIERPGLVEYVVPEVAGEVGADLALIGRLGSLDRLTTGLIGLLLVRRTPCSVLLVRPHLTRVRRVLVCTEGPLHGPANVEQAIRAARAFGARLTLLHVASQMGITEHASETLQRELLDYLASDRPEAVHLREMRRQMTDAGVEGQVKVRRGLVVDEILHEVHEGGYDLLLIGAHATTGREGFLYEDLASLIVRASPISTLVIRSAATTGATGGGAGPAAGRPR